MCQVIAEPGQLLNITVQPVKHEINGMCQITELLWQIVCLYSMGQVPGGDSLRNPAKGLQWLQPTMDDPPRATAYQQQDKRQGDDCGFHIRGK